MNSESPRLASPWLLALLTAAVVLTLYVVAPRGSIRQRLESSGPPSALSVAYLEAWTKTQPNNVELVALLASQYAALGRTDDAERLAERMEASGSAQMRRDAVFVLERVAAQRYFALPAHDTRRPQALAHWRSSIADAVQGRPSTDELARLAQRAVAAADPQLAMRIYERLSDIDPGAGNRWDAEVARYALQAGEYRQAAAAWFRRQDAAHNREDARRYFLAAIAALRQGNLMDEALAAADAHLGTLADDPATLMALINLARAANRPKAIDRYARMLARYALLEPGFRLVSLIGHPVAGGASGARASASYAYRDGPVAARRARAAGVMLIAASSARASRSRMLAEQPTKGEVADFAYRALIEAGDTAEAERLARRQVARDPHSSRWARRLAQAAQWNRDPSSALRAWLDYARLSDDANAWREVLRIAPMLDDDEAYLAAAIHDARGAPSDLAKIDRVTETYERLGRPDDALAFLRSLPRGTDADALDTRIGQLAERAGHDDQALAAYRAVQSRRPRDVGAALRTASVLYRLGHRRAAFAALEKARAGAKRSDTQYWRDYGELAQLLGRRGSAEDAHRHLLASGDASVGDLRDMMPFYDAYPIDAARIAELRYRRDGSMVALQDAIYYYTRAGAMSRVAALLASLDEPARRQAQASPGVLAARAEYERLSGRQQAAIADLRRASRLPGASDDVRASLLWMLVDDGADAQVVQALRDAQSKHDSSSAMWGPIAAAALRLHRPVVALEYLRRQSAQLSRDPLWLLTYADALEMAGHVDLAWSIRHKVWLQLVHERTRLRQAGAHPNRRQGPRGAQSETTRDEWRERRAALSATFATGDASVAWLDHLLAPQTPEDGAAPVSKLGETAGLPGPAAPTRADLTRNAALKRAVATQVAIAWALSSEANPLAKRWLAREYAARLSRPADARLTLALAANDVGQMERLIDDARSSRLPLGERIDAAEAIDRPALAQTLAFEGLAGAPDDDAMHTRLVDTTLAWPQSIDAMVTNHVEHPLDYVEQTLAATRKLTERYRIGVAGVQRFQRSTDENELAGVPSVDRALNLTLERRTLDTAFSVTVGRREALDSFYTLQLDAQAGRNGPLSAELHLGRNQTADENQALLVGGMKDAASGELTWRMTSRLALTASIEADRFYSQARHVLGIGILSTGELSYRLRTTYPDYTVRLVGSHGNYHAGGSADALISRLVPAADQPATAAGLMPASYAQYGFYFGFGNDLRTQYTHRWRPFLDVGLVHDSNQGWGPGVSVGVAGSVLGGDHAALYFEHQRVSHQGAPVTEIGARYSWFY